ncbi:hypothetical protein SCHPADRAFT_437556 [Schizopora paradoxa]|uniref:Uncharacterized protein n=1 Tax=Schizopora paradoxa TaxID=27342 RepID=A0A0H2S5A0_9AGAM|nr:hypothetical protein SCHPADRAFT_437556 [Schizopora paradoxa]
MIRSPSLLSWSILPSSSARRMTTSADTVVGTIIPEHTIATEIMAAAVAPFLFAAGPGAARLTRRRLINRIKRRRYRCILHECRPI